MAEQAKKGGEGIIAGDISKRQDLVDTAIRHQAPIFVGVIRHQNRVLVRTRDVDAMHEITQLHEKLDTESSLLLMEVKVLSIDLSDGYNSLFDFKVKGNDATVSTLDATSTVALTKAADTAIRAASSAFNPALLATVVSENFEARLQLLEKENRVTELATPMLMTTNQEVSRVFVGEERPIVTGYNASTTAAGGVPGSNVISNPILVPQTDLRAIGTTLLLTPNINADRTVSIQLLVEQSAVAPNQATIPVQVGDTLQDAEIDLVQERTYSGTVVAKDATAVAVGGLIEEAAENIERKVPILGDIPLLGFFFREDGQSRGRRELVIIMKPHIMQTPDEAQGVSRQTLRQNSIHPNAQNADSMDIYSNRSQRHKGYVLDQPFKEYPGQDGFDRFRGRGDIQPLSTQPKYPAPAATAASPPPAQQVYVELTRYASEAVRSPKQASEANPRISPVMVGQFQIVDLLRDKRITAMPVSGWHQGGIFVTAVELRNNSGEPVTVDFQHVKGRWLASTIENEHLVPRGQPGATSTYLYLVSGQPFADALRH